MDTKATTSFDRVITSLALCQEDGCWSMIATSENPEYIQPILDPLCLLTKEKGEIGAYNIYFCKPEAQIWLRKQITRNINRVL